MKYLLCFAALLLFLTPVALAQEAAEVTPGVVLVKFNPEVLPEIKEQIGLDDLPLPLIRQHLQGIRFERAERIFRHFMPADTLAYSRQGEPVRLLDLSRWYVVRVSKAADPIALAEALRRLPGVEAASPSFTFRTDDDPNDPRFQNGDQWGLWNQSYPGRDIHARQAWQKNTGRRDVVVAVIDGGVDLDHLDLDPGDRSRVIQGYDTADEDNDPNDDRPNGYEFANHGTRVAGIIGAISDNSRDVTGVMHNVQIMPIKAVHTGGGPNDGAADWDVAQGIDYARTHGADIVNLSLGREVPYPWYVEMVYANPMTEATLNAYRTGVTLVASMGNTGSEATQIPALYPWTIAVGNTNILDQKHSTSTTGSHISVAAPGTSLATTGRGNDPTASCSGTSCAAPMVSGTAGLILSESRDLGLNLTNVTRYGFNYETYVYWISSNLAGQQINRYYPVAPSQATLPKAGAR